MEIMGTSDDPMRAAEILQLSVKVESMIQNAPPPSYLNKHDAVCCQVTETAIKAIVATDNAQGGLAAVLSSGVRLTEWGPKRCEWLCHAWRYRKELDCGAQAALLHFMLKLSDECQTDNVSIFHISIIRRCSSEQAICWNHLFSKEDRTTERWIHNAGDVSYHECLAIDNGMSGMMVFDPASNAWLQPSDEFDSTGGVLAWLVHPPTLNRRPNEILNTLIFGNVNVPIGQWFTLVAALRASNMITVSSLVTSSYTINQPMKSMKSYITVYISGVCCNNDNPSPGLGVARSLRHGCQDSSTLRIVAVDFSLESLGLRDAVFDERVVSPEWKHTTGVQHLKHVLKLLRSSEPALYISCIDEETQIISNELQQYIIMFPESADLAARILIPPNSALAQTIKPTISAASDLGFAISNFMEIDGENTSDSDIHTWCITNGYPVFVKGRHHDAAAVYTWPEVQQTVRKFQKSWGKSSVFLQHRVTGTEGSIIFAAYKGKLLAAALMFKQIVTPSKKVWSGYVTAVPTQLLEKLRNIVCKLVWTGGGEIEFIEAVDGKRYTIDWNQRFPAWVYGTIPANKLNIPLALVQAAANDLFNVELDAQIQLKLLNDIVSPELNGEFVRTIIEHSNCGVLKLMMAGPESSNALVTHHRPSKGGSSDNSRSHPSRNTDAAKLLYRPTPTTATSCPTRDCSWISLCPNRIRTSNTPRIFFDSNVMRGQIDDVRKVLDEAIRNSSQQCMSKRLSAELALSIKTNPLPLVLTTAIDKKMMVEAISLSEVRAAIAAGFAPNDIILNGPAKWFDFSTNTSRDNSSNYSTIQLFAIIADSAAELESLAAAVKSGKTLNSSINHRSPIDLAIVGAQYIGVRLAAPGTKSRFGADIGDSEILERLAAAMRLLPVDQKILYHFHYAPSTLGIQAWAGAVKAVLLAANAIDRVAGRDCTVLDFGGGWATNTFSTLTATKTLSDIFKMASNMFPKLSQIIFEPGKSILQSAGTLLTRVLCVRESTINMRDSCSMTDKADKYSTGRVAILDTNIAELPDLHSHEHPLAWLAREPHNSTWVPLSTGNDGNDALYGRICMEHDILATSMVLPDNLQVGDWIAIGSVGAYDISMAYHFGTAPNAVLEIDNL